MSITLKLSSYLVEDERGVDEEACLFDEEYYVEKDNFDEVYKTYELTDFDRLLSGSIARTGE